MKFKSIFIKVTIFLCIIGVFAIVPRIWHRNSPGGEGSSGLGISLVRPAFAQETGISFLEQEAGISAYMNAGQRIDLSKAKSAFRTVEREMSEYVVGSVPLTGYPETEDVHVYVHKDGWIVAYYLKAEPASKIVDWNNYDTDEKINGTKLENGIFIVVGTAEISMRDIKYYDFRNPGANKMMIVAEAMWTFKSDGETFRIKLPRDFIFYERSYSHCCKGTNNYTNYMYLDEKVISLNVNNKQSFLYGLLSPIQLSLDVFHDIKITSERSSSYGGYSSVPVLGAIVLIYAES